MTTPRNNFKDWGEVSEIYDQIKQKVFEKDLSVESEAQTRFDIIDRFIREILQYSFGNIIIEEHTKISKRDGYIDYILKCGDYQILIEAKKSGAAFPSPTRNKKLKISGSILGVGEINKAIKQAEEYAIEIGAEVVIVTNGNCWCFYSRIDAMPINDIYATTLFPFQFAKDAEDLYSTFSVQNVENGSLEQITNNKVISVTNTLANAFKDSDARIDRNKIADHISLALDNAINGEAILNDENKLKYCFVHTDARTKYDSSLEIYIADKKPTVVVPARRIKKDREEDELGKSLRVVESTNHTPVTLLIGGVGAGKSTYLSHFEKIHAKQLLAERKCFWVYIDFEKLGNEDPKRFIYNSLREFSLKAHENVRTDFNGLIEPAYREDFENLARGPFSILARNEDRFEEEKQKIIQKEFEEVYPYVEKIYQYISKNNLCVIVLDNIDLFEKDDLEISVLSEGIALSKKINALIFISIRDTTFIKHKNDSIFNAHELKKFWIDPPPLREVLSKRLKFAGEILKNKRADIYTQNGMRLNIQDLSIFFEIAHTSLLQDIHARFIECIADGNIRKGISLVSNFLISGHIQVERQIQNYLSKEAYNRIPFHEVFKGCVQGLWKNFTEEKAELLNLLNSGLNSLNLQFLRIYILKLLKLRAKDKNTIETPVSDILSTFSIVGATANHINSVITDLLKNRLVSSESGETTSRLEITIHINLSGAYYYEYLLRRMEYIEAVIYDTPVFLDDFWFQIYTLSVRIKEEYNSLSRLKIRRERLIEILNYIKQVESTSRVDQVLQELSIHREIETSVLTQINDIVRKQEYFASIPKK